MKGLVEFINEGLVKANEANASSHLKGNKPEWYRG